MLIVLSVIAVVTATLCLTHNPLAILGLFFLPEPLVVQDPEQVALIQAIERELEDADGVSGTPLGFI